jgi:uncharacterized protein YjbI with pentapeptide repeats
MRTFTKDELKEILRLHDMWLKDEEGGERANLHGANLRGANLHGADLRGADLRGANGQNDYFKTITTDIWPVIYTFDRMQIGCENHSITDWKEFDEDRISEMDNNASDFWAKWKDTLFKLIEMNPAQPTGKENT